MAGTGGGDGTTVDKFLRSAHRRLRLVSAQVAGGLDEGEQLAAQARAMVVEVSAVSLDTDQAATLSTELCKLGWTADQKRQLCEAIAAANEKDAAGESAPARKQQRMDYVENYLVQALVDGLCDRSRSMDSRAALFAAYLHNWGITCGREKIYTSATAILYSYNQDEFEKASPQENGPKIYFDSCGAVGRRSPGAPTTPSPLTPHSSQALPPPTPAGPSPSSCPLPPQ